MPYIVHKSILWEWVIPIPRPLKVDNGHFLEDILPCKREVASREGRHVEGGFGKEVAIYKGSKLVAGPFG
jgi:energy-converting hydrogenase A subunit M